MDTILLQTLQLIMLLCPQVQLHHLKERVSVLRSELNGELQIPLGIVSVVMFVSG